MHKVKRSTRVLAGLSVVALVAIAACGDDDDNATTNTTTANSVKTGTTAPTSGAATTAGGSTETTGGGSTETTGATGSTEAATQNSVSKGERTSKDNGEPVQGGTLVYGGEADTANPWAPYRASSATAGRAIIRTISDPLFSEDKDGKPVPYLVESVEHNADYTQWTLHMRDGIKFHDGTPLDGAAVKFNIDASRTAPLTASAFFIIDHVDASGQDVVITTKGPFVALPAGFPSFSPTSYMFSPKWLASLPDVPQRDPKSPVYDATLAATPASGDPAKPVGLGAFMYKSYTPGNGNAFVAVRNPDYWRGPKGITGEKLPYLDEIDFVVAADEETRSNSVRSGDFDLMMTSMGDTINQFLDDKSFKIDSSTKFGDTGYIMLNTATGPETDPQGTNAASPLLNLDCRKALAGAIDRDRVNQERGAGLSPAANGPFPPGSAGYLKDSGYPKFDVTAAQAEMDKCLAGTKSDHIEFNFNTTSDPFNVETVALIASMWSDAFGDKVQTKTTPLEQGQFIGVALNGGFQADTWRSHFGSDPYQQRVWWGSEGAAPIGQLALNLGRFKDPVIDKAFQTITANPDEAARTAAAEDINKEFGAQVWNLWLTWVLWGIIQQPYVNGVQDNKLPDGTQGIGLAYLGLHNTNQMWCDNGKCE